jgi:DNA repair exonuclease SbcCD ATPase subunit
MESAAEELKPQLQPMADERISKISEDAWEEFYDGKKEYEDGLKEFNEEKERALQELEDAYSQLLEAEQIIQENEQKLEDGKKQIAGGWAQLRSAEKELEDGKAQLESYKSMLFDPIDSAENAIRKDYDAAVAQRDELNGQIHNPTLAPIMKYGLLKERFAALLTDGLRAEYLEREGYDAQILEFIDMEHTPKNILIRAVKKEKKIDYKKGKVSQSIHDCEEFFHAAPKLGVLLDGEKTEEL